MFPIILRLRKRLSLPECGEPDTAKRILDAVSPGGEHMKMNGQSRSFVKQVQEDLLVLSDADLSNIIHGWIDGYLSSERVADVPDETRLALGYSLTDREEPEQWLAPAPQHLRALLSVMDVSAFAQHVIPIAYQALHSAHPEWYDGVTFNAHLANYLRQTQVETVAHKQRAAQRR
jgi:hypothetical protein